MPSRSLRSGQERTEGEAPFLSTWGGLWTTLMGSPNGTDEDTEVRGKLHKWEADTLDVTNSQYMVDSVMAPNYPHLLVFMPLVIPSP